MKKILSSIVLVCTFYLSAENEPKISTLAIDAQRGAYTIQEQISHILFTQRNLFVVKNEEKKSTLFRINGNNCTALVADRIKINHEQKENPLLKSPISYIALGREDNLYITMHANPATLYMFTSLYHQDIRMLAASDIHDAEGKAIAGIVALANGTVPDGKISAPYTLLAVKKHDGHFGEPGSGIAVIRYDADVKEEKKKKENEADKEEENKQEKEQSKPFFDILDSSTGTSHGNKAVALDLNALSIQDGLESIEYDVADLHWSDKLSRCYIALSLKTKKEASDDQGACALLVARIDNRKLFFEPVVNHAALKGNAIVGATGSDKSIRVHKVTTMSLINGLNYLVLVGGNAEGCDGTQSVYAFPLVNMHYAASKEDVDAQKIHGTIAKKGALPALKAHPNGSLSARVFEDAVTNKEEFYTADDSAVRVGAGHVLPGPIQDITTQGDSIIVSIADDGNGMAAGAFYSQAIVNEQGVVAAWSGWQRVPGGDKKTVKTIAHVGEFKFLYKDGPEKFFSARSTGWHTPQNLNKDIAVALDPVQACVTTHFAPGSFCSIADYSITTPGVSSKESPFSMLVGLGKEKVLMLQTSKADEHGIVRPFCESYDMVFETKTGSLKSFSKTKEHTVHALSITGGALSDCGVLSCSAVGASGNDAWLFVGGSGGLAVLSRAQGAGWNAKQGLQHGFKALYNDFAFKKLGNYSFVRKLVCCDGYLYVLTHKGLDRIVLNSRQYASAQLHVEQIIPETLYKQGKKIFYNDILVSSDLILLATSEGLYAGHPEKPLSWKKIEFPHTDVSAMSLSSVSISGHEQDFAYKGQVYVVARSANYKLTYIYRLFVDVSQEDAVKVVYDCSKKDQKRHWIRYVPHQQYFVTDGMSLYSYCSRGNQQEAKVSLIPNHDIRGNNIIKRTQLVQLPLLLEDAQNVRTMIRNSATGSWLVAGDFGLRVNM